MKHPVSTYISKYVASMYVPWKQNVDLSVVVVVMADAKKALGVTMYCHAEQPRILHSLNLSYIAVGKVGDNRELFVEMSGQIVSTEIAHDSKGVVNPSKVLDKKRKEPERSDGDTSIYVDCAPRARRRTSSGST